MHENINGVLLKPLSGGGNESIDPTLKVRMQQLSQLLKRVDQDPLPEHWMHLKSDILLA